MAVALIIGCTGQDGSYLAESLIDRGYEVHGAARDAEPTVVPRDVAGRMTLHRVDLAVPSTIPPLLERVQPDLVFNLAAISSVYQSWQQPVLTGIINGVAVAQLLESALQLQDAGGRPVRIVQASSAEIFGNPASAPQDESTPIAPVSPYGASKAYAHAMVAAFRQKGLFASNVILYNHESPRRPPTFVTRKITLAAARIALGDRDPLRLGTLESRRDWGWAPDYVEAMVLAAEAPEADDFVIATGVDHSVGDFVEAAFRHAGVPDWRAHVELDEEFRRPAEAAQQRGDARKAHAILGWTPSRGFDDVVAAMVEADLAGQADGAID